MKKKVSQVTKLILVIVCFVSCNLDKEIVIEKFSPEKPYAVEMARERSYYQAEKLTDRLIDLGQRAYMIQHSDSVENAGKWFYILCESVEELDSARAARDRIETALDLSDLKIVKYQDFMNSVFDLDSLKEIEKKNIITNRPAVNEEVYSVVNKFPESNALLVQKTFVFNAPKDPDNLSGYSALNSYQLDLPRGISRNLMLERTTAFSEVIYKDNLYGDQVTIDIGKLRNSDSFIQADVNEDDGYSSSFAIAEEYADLILATGEYLFEEKNEIEVESYVTLHGYEVTIEPTHDYFRKYLILVDESNQYLIFSQSTDKSDRQLLAILADLGKGAGLLDYDEFYNTFYTIPENIIDQDQFLGFTIDKLDWQYAVNRGYVKWSKEMVGHWNATGYFLNDKKGVWTYSIFDLLTRENQDYIYGGLYSTETSENKHRVNVYGTDGFVIYEDKINWDTWDSYKKTSEISFGIDRYVAAIGNTENSWFIKNELLERAESLQFEKVGHSITVNSPKD